MHVIFTLLMLAAVGFGLWLLGSILHDLLVKCDSWHEDDPEDDDYDW